eukprot:gene8235-9082_t
MTWIVCNIQMICFLALFLLELLFFPTAIAWEAPAAVSSLSEPAIVSLFSRLAEQRILLDIPGAGTPELAICCHSGCENCAYSSVFDEMTASAPKWLPLYPFRKLADGREHQSAFYSRLVDSRSFTDACWEKDVGRESFISALAGMQPRSFLGMPNTVKLAAIRDEDCLLGSVFLWEYLCQGNMRDRLTIRQIYDSLRERTVQDHGAGYSDFKRVFKPSR